MYYKTLKNIGNNDFINFYLHPCSFLVFFRILFVLAQPGEPQPSFCHQQIFEPRIVVVVLNELGKLSEAALHWNSKY